MALEVISGAGCFNNNSFHENKLRIMKKAFLNSGRTYMGRLYRVVLPGIFFLASAIVSQGQTVEYEEGEGRKGPCAENVRVVE